MTDEELIEQVARAIDPAAWEVGQPIPTREAVVAYHSARQASIAKARAILPIIKAERIRGGEMVKEAAAGIVCGLVAKHATDATIADVADQLGQVIRALSVPAIVEAGEQQPPARDYREALCFIGKWVERGLFCKTTSPQDALSIIANFPGMPWNSERWDVDHKPYAEEYYAMFPETREVGNGGN